MPSALSQTATDTIQRVNQERAVQEHARPLSFWDKFSALGTGQKIGRVFLGVLTLGLSEIKAAVWQSARVATNPCPDVNSTIASRAVIKIPNTQKEGDERQVPKQQTFRLGRAERHNATQELVEFLRDGNGSADEPDISEETKANSKFLHKQFVKDCNRGTFSLSGPIQNQITCFGMGTGTGDTGAIGDKDACIRKFLDFFGHQFPDEDDKAHAWAVYTSRALHQGGLLAATAQIPDTQIRGTIEETRADSKINYRFHLSDDRQSGHIEISQSGNLTGFRTGIRAPDFISKAGEGGDFQWNEVGVGVGNGSRREYNNDVIIRLTGVDVMGRGNPNVELLSYSEEHRM